MKTPEQIKSHSEDYQDDSWKLYTEKELLHWVQNLSKRATQRTNVEKAKKDIYDARNYMAMLQAKLNHMIDESEKRIV